ncbi:MAG: hypothetical protein NC212_03125 [Staphylococcus sp.]|nr:hypothetical protein [Staphylococcus sp.]
MAFFSCTSSDDEPAVSKKPRTEIPLSRSQQTYVDNESRFAFDFLKAVNQEEIAGNNINFAISPLSMARDLSMFANGASGETLDAVMRMLHMGEGESVAELNELNSILLQALLDADSDVALNVANSFWYSDKFPVKESYMDMIRTHYNAAVEQVDFLDNSTVGKINGWCKEATDGVIKNIFPYNFIDPTTKFMLLDAVHFKAAWPVKFVSTQDESFFNYGNSEVKVATMNQRLAVNIGGDERTTVVQLPYGNRAISMYVVMAEEGHDINDVISGLDLDKWMELKESLYIRDVDILIPKFNINYNPDLKEVMSNMGLDCNRTVEIENMTDDKSATGLEIKQYTSVKIDESGAEVATVSNISGGYGSPGPNENRIHINRPFIFIIEEYSTNAILFVGKVVRLGY